MMYFTVWPCTYMYNTPQCLSPKLAPTRIVPRLGFQMLLLQNGKQILTIQLNHIEYSQNYHTVRLKPNIHAHSTKLVTGNIIGNT